VRNDVIEKNGGILEDTVMVRGEKPTRRYWIELQSQATDGR
jgi:predicted acetyltransferase